MGGSIQELIEMGKTESAEEMLRDNLPVEKIAQYTNLPIEKIEELKKSLNL